MNVFDEDLCRIALEIKQLGFANRTFFITGANGLIGSILVKSIVYANEVYQLNNSVIAQVRSMSKANSTFKGYRGIVYNVGDVRDVISYSGRVDFIVHAASETKSLNMIKRPVETLWTALSGTKNLLDFANAKKVKKMVYISSMEAFGTVEEERKASESMLGYIDLSKVRSCYPESKRMAENMCVCYSSEYSVPVTIARLAQTFGAGVSLNDMRVFAQFAHSVIENCNIVLHTKGESCGNYVYTADVANAIFRLLRYGVDGECYTVANESSSMKIKDMAKLVADKIARGKINVVIDIPKENKFGYAADVKLKLDSSKIQMLGWKPMISLEESYIRLIRYWRGQ